MTPEEVANLPIEEIIRMSNFESLISHSGKSIGGSLMNPYWEIRFSAERKSNGKFEAFGREIIFPTYIIHKYK